MDFKLVCPECGGAILHNCVAQSGLNGERNPGANPELGQVAHVSKTSSRKPYNQGYEQEFLAFWKVYPLHKSKRKAQIAWRKAIKHASANAILSGAIRYRDDPTRKPEFTKYAEGWLNDSRWEDEYEAPRRGPMTQDEIDAEVEAFIAEGKA